MMIFLLLLRDILLVLALNVVFLVPNVLVDMSKWLQRLMVRGKYCLLPAIWLYITERGHWIWVFTATVSKIRTTQTNFSHGLLFSCNFCTENQSSDLSQDECGQMLARVGYLVPSQKESDKYQPMRGLGEKTQTNERAAAPAPAYHCLDLHNKQ